MPQSLDLARTLASSGHLSIALDAGTCDLLHRGIEASRTFFRRPIDEKRNCALPQDCGYRDTGVEYSQSPDRPDPIESFTVSERTRDAGARLEPESGRALHEALMLLFDALLAVAQGITHTVARELLDDSPSPGSLRDWSCVQVNYSRPSQSLGKWIHEDHEDGHLWTLAHATGPGLELATPDGFAPVQPKACEVVVMPGEIARLMSGGAISPLYHRVRPSPECDERIATLLFADVDPSHCAPWVLNDNNRGVDIASRIRQNAARFGLRGFNDD